MRLVTDGIGPWEAPRWHEGLLWFSGIPRRVVCRLADDGTVEKVCAVPGRPSGLGWLPDGRLLVVSMHERGVYRFDGERLEVPPAWAPSSLPISTTWRPAPTAQPASPASAETPT